MTELDPLWVRPHILIGDAGMERLRAAHVMIAGVGGVGSFVAEALARAGVGALTLIDHDRVDPTNLNRQLLALRSTVGQLKVEVMAARIADINPGCGLTPLDQFIPAEDAGTFFPPDCDLIVDAIDSLSSKVALLEAAWKEGRPILSSMGAGGRLDPTRVQVGDLMDTRVCALAREVRSRLRKRAVGRGIQVVWSDEQPLPPLPPQPVAQGRARAVNGTVSYMPALFGLTLAGLVVQRLLATPSREEDAVPVSS